MVSAHLSATGRLDQVATLCLGVTLLDMMEAGTTVLFIDEAAAKASILATCLWVRCQRRTSRAVNCRLGHSQANTSARVRPSM